ncbi:MAG: S8 family serine peptidase, partial [Maricaulaceae bacterium]
MATAVSLAGVSGGVLGQIHEAYTAAQRGDFGAFAAVQASGTLGGAILGDQFVIIDVTAADGDGAALLQVLEALGLQSGASFGALASGAFPIANLPALDDLSGVRAVTPSLFTTNSVSPEELGLAATEFELDPALAASGFGEGSVINEGIFAHNVDVLRTAFGVDGSGVTVGVISDTFNATGGLAADIASGDLPADIEIILDAPSGTDEARALLQLVFDLAPGADLLVSGINASSRAGFAQTILDQAEAGADIIADDIFFFTETVFQDGIIAQAVDQVAEDGVLFFSSGGNNGRDGFRDAFRDSGITVSASGEGGSTSGTAFDFDPGVGVDTQQLILVDPGDEFTLIISYDDPSFIATGGQASPDTDIDAVIRDAATGEVLAVADTDNLAFGEPTEGFVDFVVPDGVTAINLEIIVAAGDAPQNIAYTLLEAPSSVVIAEFDTEGPTAFGHTVAEGAFGVAAGFFELAEPDNPFGVSPTPQGNFFTSNGPATIFLDTDGNRLAEPEVRIGSFFTAADGVSTSIDTFDPFFGTSASVAQAAGIAALLKSAFPEATPDQIIESLVATAADIQVLQASIFGAGPDIVLPEGFDNDTGAGFIQADAAAFFLEELLSEAPPPPPPPP